MKHLAMVSSAPAAAASVSAEVILTFLQDYIGLIIPLVQNKDPENPDGTTTPTDTTT